MKFGHLEGTSEEINNFFEDNGLNAAKTAGLYTVVTPTYWTQAENFSAADLVLPSLGSAARPLPRRAAALLGHTLLGIREIDAQLRSRENTHSAAIS